MHRIRFRPAVPVVRLRSDGGEINSSMFVRGSDVFMQATTPAFIELNFNGQFVKVPNWPSARKAISRVVFE